MLPETTNDVEETLSAIFQGSTSSLGKEPRLFVLSPDGLTLLCANQESDTIVAFRIQADGGLVGGRIVAEVGSPTAICFLPPIVGERCRAG